MREKPQMFLFNVKVTMDGRRAMAGQTKVRDYPIIAVDEQAAHLKALKNALDDYCYNGDTENGGVWMLGDPAAEITYKGALPK